MSSDSLDLSNNDLITFVEKHSRVPREFIESFFSIVSPKYSIHDFRIKFEEACKWIGVRKDNLKRLMISSGFEKGVDYYLKRVSIPRKNKHSGANIYETILLTPECFKELCMMSKSDRAIQVRRYYLAVEQLVFDFYGDMEAIKEKKLELCEKDRKGRTKIESGVVYFIKAMNTLDPDVYKIGSTANIDDRFNVYNEGNANKIVPDFFLKTKNHKGIEACAKSMLMPFKYSKNKEMYQIKADKLKDLFYQCQDLSDGFTEQKGGFNSDYFLVVIPDELTEEDFEEPLKLLDILSNEYYDSPTSEEIDVDSLEPLTPRSQKSRDDYMEAKKQYIESKKFSLEKIQ